MNLCRGHNALALASSIAAVRLNGAASASRFKIRFLAFWHNSLIPLIIAAVLASTPTAANAASNEEAAYTTYFNGHVLDTIEMLEKAIAATPDPNEKWALASELMDICIDSYQYQ